MTNAWRLWAVTVSVASLVGSLQGIAQEQVAASGAAPESAPDAVPAAAKNPVDLGLGLRAEYTDNRDATEANEESTFDFYVTPRIDAYISTDRTLFDLYYAPSLRYRTDPNRVQNDTELLHDLGLKLDHAMSAQTKVRLHENFAYQDDPSISEEGGTIRENRSYYRNRVELGLQQNLSRASFADVSGEYYLKRYDDDDAAQTSDEDRTGGQALLWYGLSRTLGVRGTVGATAYGYESPFGIDRDFDVLQGSVGLDNAVNPQLRFGLDVGVQSVEYSDSTLDSEVFPYGQFNAQLAPNPGFRIKGSLAHGVRDSDAFPFASQEYTDVRATVESDLTSATVGVDGLYRLSDYSGDTRPAGSPAPAGGEATDGDETTMSLAGRATWTVGQNARLSLRHTLEDVDSDVAESFTKNTSSIDLQLDI